MKVRKLRSDLYCAFVWAIFTLGASQLALVLGGPIFFLIAMLCCASLFAFFLFKVQDPGNRSIRQIAKPYLFSTGILLAASVFYVYLVLLKSDLSDVIFLSVHILLFMIPLLITIPFLRSPSNVSQ